MLQMLQHLPTIATAGQGIAQRGFQAIEGASREQEGAHRVGLPPQRLDGQVIRERAVRPVEGCGGRGGGHVRLEREGGELQPGRPSLHPGRQCDYVVGGEVDAHGPGEEGAGLIGGKAQVGGADLDELATRAEERQRDRGIGPAGDQDVDVGGQMVDEAAQGIVDGADGR